MLYPPEFFDRIRCSRSKKKECAGLIASIISFSEKTRRVGLLALEADLENLSETMMKKGLQLVIDGTDPDIVYRVLYTLMMSSCSRGIELLKGAIMLEGVLGIQAGDSPRVLAEKMSSLLGRDIDLWEAYRDVLVNQVQHSCVDDASGEHGAVVNAEVDGQEFEVLAAMADIFIQKILRETDTHVLIIALKGSSAALREKITRNMSNRAAMLLKEDIEYMGPILREDVVASQEKILTTAMHLAASGELIFPGKGELVE